MQIPGGIQLRGRQISLFKIQFIHDIPNANFATKRISLPSCDISLDSKRRLKTHDDVDFDFKR